MGSYRSALDRSIYHYYSIPEIDDLKLKSVLEKVDHGIYDDLHDMSICPLKYRDESKGLFTINFTILKNFGAINQFKMGLKSLKLARVVNLKLVFTD